MRISDWSSDVCSSDLLQALHTSNAAKWHNGLPLHSIKNRYRADLLQRRDQESKTAAGHKHAQLHFTARMTRPVGKDGNPPNHSLLEPCRLFQCRTSATPDRKSTRLNSSH